MSNSLCDTPEQRGVSASTILPDGLTYLGEPAQVHVRGSTSIVFRQDALLSDHKRQRNDEQLHQKNHPQLETTLENHGKRVRLAEEAH